MRRREDMHLCERRARVRRGVPVERREQVLEVQFRVLSERGCESVHGVWCRVVLEGSHNEDRVYGAHEMRARLLHGGGRHDQRPAELCEVQSG